MFVYFYCYAVCVFFFFFFKQKTAYEMRISDWSSDVCSSDLSWSNNPYIGSEKMNLNLFSLKMRFIAELTDNLRGDGAVLLAEKKNQLKRREIGGAHVRNPVTTPQPECGLLLEKKKNK